MRILKELVKPAVKDKPHISITLATYSAILVTSPRASGQPDTLRIAMASESR